MMGLGWAELVAVVCVAWVGVRGGVEGVGPRGGSAGGGEDETKP